LGDSSLTTIRATASRQIVAAHAFFFGLNLLRFSSRAIRSPASRLAGSPSFDIRRVDLHSIQMT
jgi:hypothetical protein